MNFLLPCLAVAFFLASSGLTQNAAAPGEPAPSGPAQSASIELAKLDKADDAAQAEVDQWVLSNKRRKAEGAGVPDAELEKRISERFEPVRRGYEDLVARYPRDARGHLAFGNFLNARDDERGAQREWEKALELDPKNADIYNNLAGRYGESGPVNKSFEYFSKAIELNPNEPMFYHNFGDVLYLLRKQAAEYYHSNEQDVYGRCLLLYSNALRLDPQNFPFARDLAQTYYSLKPLPIEPALQAWTNALAVARQEPDRQDVYVHLARVKMFGGRFSESRAQLSIVTDAGCLQAKTNLLKNIEQLETSAVSASAEKK